MEEAHILEKMVVCNSPNRHDDLNNYRWGMIRGKPLNKPFDNRCSNMVQGGKPMNKQFDNRWSNRWGLTVVQIGKSLNKQFGNRWSNR